MELHGTTVAYNNVSGSGEYTGGGGLVNYAESGLTASLTLVDSFVNGNLARNSVGGGFINLSDTDGTAALTLANTKVWQAPNTLNPNEARYGGGIYNREDDGLAIVSLRPGTVITRNKASVTGGGICNYGGSVVSTGALIMFNTPNNWVDI